MYYVVHDSHARDAAGMGDAVHRTADGNRSLNGKQSDKHAAIQVIPVTRTIPLPAADPYTLFCALDIDKGYILESMEGVPRRAVRSIIGMEPDFIISLGENPECSGKGSCLRLFSPPKGADPVRQLRSLSSQIQYMGTGDSDFTGGFVGYCSYDMVSGLTGGHVQAGRDEIPLARFMLSTRGIVYNHVQGSCLLFDDLVLPPGSDADEEHQRASERLRDLEARIRSVLPAESLTVEDFCMDPLPDTGVEDRTAYETAVIRAKEHIMAGDIFQVVLSRKIALPFTGEPLGIYGRIRVINPSPYLYYLDFGDEAIVGSSPEMLVKVQERVVQTVPIAGTRPRGKNVEEDTRLARELLSDEKERAEHLMLVDLARNDIGRVAEFGSVTVPEFMDIEKFSHVQHIVSRVCGVIAEGKDRFDALASCFPAGTVSGAPKIRAMQIIADLESGPRGLYAGAVGYSGFDNLLEFAIAIRTIRVRGGLAEFSTGAGIVADSVAEKEFEETGHKAQAMIRAVRSTGDAL
ncbi:MAG: anthranilate synthase component I family protein [Methanoregulaceae archaeon]|nr:anthranilate synthase component I family protein [Methanoregulaceae archaeon]